MKDFLEKQLERTNYWLAFSEAKNAALLAFNVAIVAASASYGYNNILNSVMVVIFLISSLLALLSFSPNLDKIVNYRGSKIGEDLNLIFFLEVANFDSPRDYIMNIRLKYGIESDDNSMNVDLASEIIANSRIAVIKYNLFKKAVGADFIAIMVLVVINIIA